MRKSTQVKRLANAGKRKRMYLAHRAGALELHDVLDREMHGQLQPSSRRLAMGDA